MYAMEIKVAHQGRYWQMRRGLGCVDIAFALEMLGKMIENSIGYELIKKHIITHKETGFPLSVKIEVQSSFCWCF